MPSMKYDPGLHAEGTPFCPFGYKTRRKGIEYNHQTVKWSDIIKV